MTSATRQKPTSTHWLTILVVQKYIRVRCFTYMCHSIAFFYKQFCAYTADELGQWLVHTWITYPKCRPSTSTLQYVECGHMLDVHLDGMYSHVCVFSLFVALDVSCMCLHVENYLRTSLRGSIKRHSGSEARKFSGNGT